MHWGNILVEETDLKKISYVFSQNDSSSTNIEISTSGIQVTLIDFTLSRFGKNDEEIFCKNLDDDPELFQGLGKDHVDGDLQFDIYRYQCFF